MSNAFYAFLPFTSAITASEILEGVSA